MSKVGAWFPEGLRNRGDPTVLQAQSCTGLAEAKACSSLASLASLASEESEESCRQTARCQEFRAGAFSVPVRTDAPTLLRCWSLETNHTTSEKNITIQISQIIQVEIWCCAAVGCNVVS
jgi:hypothetical protein